MRTIVSVVLAALAALATPAPALAWGTAAHRFIIGRAIDALPAPIKPFFDHFRTELVIRIVDPDNWRTVGWDDEPSHFLDLGAPEFGPYPFVALPREYGAAIEKFGTSALKRLGVVPWREAEEFGNLRRAMESFSRNSTFAPTDTMLFTAAASHYIEDACQPLHATNNYDGQLTGQTGVHSRFESALFDRFQSRLTIAPPVIKPIVSARDRMFEILLESYQSVQPLLDADKAALGSGDAYDDGYFERFFAGVKPMLEQRISESIAATASLIVGAWEAAGKPDLKAEMPRTVQKIKR